MKPKTKHLLGVAVVCQFGVVALIPGASAGGTQDFAASAQETQKTITPAPDTPAGKPGPLNAITDVPGVQVGQVQSDTAPYLTGTTVVYMPELSVAGAAQRGGAPATKETDLLSALNSNPGVNAIQLGGSSMYGLSATNGIIRWLEDQGKGIPLGPGGVAPIVPAADIFDLGRGGDPKARTSAEWGYLAAKATSDGPVRQGSVGGGTGARSGGLRSGVGTASVSLGKGKYVGAVVIVNSAGSAVDSKDCSLLGKRYGIGDEFKGLETPTKQACKRSKTKDRQDLNTTIAVVATNVPLEKAAAERLSGNANDGLARAIDPIHTLADGDTVFGVSTGAGDGLQINDPSDSSELDRIFNAGATTLTRAVTHAVLAAKSTDETASYCDTYKGACNRLTAKIHQWQTAGTAPDVTPKSFREASRRLKQTPIPQPGQPAAKEEQNSTSKNTQNAHVSP